MIQSLCTPCILVVEVRIDLIAVWSPYLILTFRNRENLRKMLVDATVAVQREDIDANILDRWIEVRANRRADSFECIHKPDALPVISVILKVFWSCARTS